MRRLALVAVVCLGLASCSPTQDQGHVVAAIGNSAIIPNLDAAVTGFENLDAAVTVYCNEPGTETLIDAREAWVEAKSLWEPAQPNTFFDSGRDAQTVSKVDHDPASSNDIEQLLESDVVIDSNYVADEATPAQRGLGTMEFLLFDREDSDERSCNLLEGASIVALGAVRELRDDWTNTYDGLAPFIDQYTEEKSDREALGDTIGAIAETLRRQTTFAASGSDLRPEMLEEGPAGAGAMTYLAQLQGIESWLIAGEETSLLELIRNESVDVAGEIEASLHGAFAILETMDEPLKRLAIDDPERLWLLHEHLDNLRVLFEGDVVNLLDLTGSSRNTQ